MVDAGEPKRFAALQNPTFRTYWILSWISQTGDGMESVVRNWLILQYAGESAPLWLGLMVFAHWIPFTVFSLYGGVLADRYDSRRVQLAAQLLLFICAFGSGIAVLTGHGSLWVLFLLLLVHGTGGAIGNPAQQTLIHSIVGPEQILSAVSSNSALRQTSQIIGPALAGVLILAAGPGWGFIANGLTFIPLMAFLVVLRITRRGVAPQRTTTLAALRDGLAHLRRQPVVASLMGASMLDAILLGNTFNSLLPVFATVVLRLGAAGYAALLMAEGVGAVVAGVWLAWSGRRETSPRIVMFALMATQIATLAFALSGNLYLSLALLAVNGFVTVMATTGVNTTVQLSAPDEIRGRVMGAYSFSTSGMRVINGPLVGGVATLIGVPLAVAGSSAVILAGTLALFAKVPQLRAQTLPTAPPALSAAPDS